MGWDYEFTLDSPDWPTNRKLLSDIVEAMLSSNAFTFKRMTVYSYDLYIANHGRLRNAKVASFETSDISPLPTLNVWVSQFTEAGTLFDIVFRVQRFEFMGEYVNREVHIYAFDKQFRAYPGHSPTGLTYDSHSSKLYSPRSNPDDYKKNISLLLTELEILVKAGVTSIRGLNGYEDSTDLMTHCLCYHQDIANFMSDLHQIDPNHSVRESFNQDDLREIIRGCENILSKQISNGFVVWAKNGTRGSLTEFYQELLKWGKE